MSSMTFSPPKLRLPTSSSYASHLTAHLVSTEATPVLLTLILICLTITVYYGFVKPNAKLTNVPEGNDNKILKHAIPFLGDIQMYNARGNWIKTHLGGFEQGKQPKPVRTSVNGHVLTVLPGAKFAKGFFGNRDLAFTEAYAALFAGITISEKHLKPLESDSSVDDAAAALRQADDESQDAGVDAFMRGPPPKGEPESTQWTLKHLRFCLSNKRLQEDDVMRKIAGDYKNGIEQYILPQSNITGSSPAQWKGQTGQFDPHEQLYLIMFQVSMRVVGCTEIVADKDKIAALLSGYWDMENNNGFLNTFYNFIPLRSNYKRVKGGISLYLGLKKPIEQRIKEGKREDDYVQRLIDWGIPSDDMVKWLIGMLFASIINTSGMTTWTLIFASADRKMWKKMQAEIDSTIARLSAARGDSLPADATIHDKIAAITIEEWEAEFNFTYWCLRETMRLLSNDFLFRKAKPRREGPTKVGDAISLKNGEFAGFLAESVHRDQSIYPDPEKWDPERWERGQGQGTYDFVGWGAGLHPCIGMKLAKNEIKMALACFVGSMDIEPVDDKGVVYQPETIPRADKYGHLRKPTAPLKLRYTMRNIA